MSEDIFDYLSLVNEAEYPYLSGALGTVLCIYFLTSSTTPPMHQGHKEFLTHSQINPTWYECRFFTDSM